MPQTLTNVLIHIVFGTKNRERWIKPDVEKELHRYLSTTFRSLDSPVLIIGGTENHVHILCRLSRTITIAKLVEKAKTGSSKWIKTKGEQYKNFAWQSGYGAFSVGNSIVDSLKKYIANQKEHHKNRDFKSEFVELLKKYDIDYDERYLWD